MGAVLFRRLGLILNCDICGRQIRGAYSRVVVEGAIMTACSSCARLGTPYEEPKATHIGRLLPTPRPSRPLPPRPAPPQPADSRAPREIRELDLADNYPQIIQKGRKKHGLSQEDLAMKVKERLSIIQKIELGKMVPDMRLARTMEHVLRIKLLVPRSELPAPKVTASGGKEVTLADIAIIHKKDEEEAAEGEEET